jgi:predicted ATPase/DNA-binding NarL/FixJ family response regulator
MAPPARHLPQGPLLKPLTQREAEILTLLVHGLSNAEIAGRLTLALSSIKWYVRQLYTKLDVHSRQQAIARAKDLELVDQPTPTSGRAERDRSQANLPVPLSSFVGREHQKAELIQLLSSSAVRLLTLTGAAGCGKTRLALEVATELLPGFQGRVWWTDLTTLADPVLVPQVVASALAVHEQPSQTSLATLVDHLQPAPSLLVLDNCEHLLAACAEVAHALLSACPDLKVLATSREALAISDETTWPVLPLSLPASDQLSVSAEKLLESEAVRLFAERARAALSTFALTKQNGASVAQVCRRVDGIPLAIELAAARMKVLTTAQIAERLDHALGLLTRNDPVAAHRHATLRAALDWSHDLLSAQEQALLRRVSIFSGGFALEAAEAICAGAPLESDQILDVLSDLVDHSLIVVESPAGGIRRFRLLQIVHQYADEKLKAAGEFVGLRDRHLDWCLKLAEQARPELSGPRQATWMARLEQERGNLRAALGWSLAGPDRIEAGMQVASALVQFWQLRGDFSEGLAWLDRLVTRSAAAPLPLQANLLEGKGFLTFHGSALDEAQSIIVSAKALYEKAGDLSGVGRQLHLLAHLALGRGDIAQALDFASQGLEIHRAAGDKWWTAACLFALGDGAFLQGDVASAAECYQESLALCQELGHAFAIARRLIRLGQVASVQSHFTRAHTHLVEGLALARQVGDNWGVTMALAGLGGLAVAQRQPERAARLLGATQARLHEFGAHFWPLDRFEFDRLVETLPTMLAPEAVKTHSDEGRAQSPEQALAYALETPEVEEQAPWMAQTGSSKPLAGLTQREAEILSLIAAGESNRAIAGELVLSVRTVERHTANIYQKLGVTGPAARTAAANFAFHHGLVPPLTRSASTIPTPPQAT